MSLASILEETERHIGEALEATGDGVDEAADEVAAALVVAVRLVGQSQMIHQRLLLASRDKSATP